MDKGHYKRHHLEASDQYLLEGCLKKDKRAQRELYERYKVAMYRLCLRYAKDRQEAEDILQDGFIKVFADLPGFRGDGALGGWIRRVMINTALQHVRQQKKLFPIESLDHIPDPIIEAPIFSNPSRVKTLTKIIQLLPTGYRTVFNLFVIEGYTHKEIAESLGISVNTSKSQLSKAKAMLRKMLEKSMIS